MVYTGHKKTTMVDGQSLVDWITPTIKDEAKLYGVQIPDERQIALVISALRMHTIIMHAAEYDYSVLSKPDEKDTLWPLQSSVGRYFRDAARETLDKKGLAK